METTTSVLLGKIFEMSAMLGGGNGVSSFFSSFFSSPPLPAGVFPGAPAWPGLEGVAGFSLDGQKAMAATISATTARTPRTPPRISVRVLPPPFFFLLGRVVVLDLRLLGTGCRSSRLLAGLGRDLVGSGLVGGQLTIGGLVGGGLPVTALPLAVGNGSLGGRRAVSVVLLLLAGLVSSRLVFCGRRLFDGEAEFTQDSRFCGPQGWRSLIGTWASQLGHSCLKLVVVAMTSISA